MKNTRDEKLLGSLITQFCLASIFVPMGLSARQVVTCEKLFTGVASSISYNASVITVEDGDAVYRWENGAFKLIPEMSRANDMSYDGKVITGSKVNPDTNTDYWYIWRNGHMVAIGNDPVLSTFISGDGKVAVAIRNTLPSYFLRYQIGFLQEIPSPFGGAPIHASLSYNGEVIVGDDLNFGGFYLANNIWTALDPLPGDKFCHVSDVSDDGLIIVGRSINENQSLFWGGTSCYWENGVPHPLKNYDEYLLSRNAWQVSGDGTVILGVEAYDIGIYEYILWRKEDMWEPISIRNSMAETGIGPNISNWLFTRCLLSRDGKTIIVTALTPENTEESFRVQMKDIFGNYSIHDDIADTGGWLGRVYARHDPWIWCENAPCWLFVPEETAIAEKGWLYAHDKDELWVIPVDGTSWGYSVALNKWLYLAGSGWIYMP